MTALKTLLLLSCLCLAPVPKAAQKPLRIEWVFVLSRGTWYRHIIRENTNEEWYFSGDLTEQWCREYIQDYDTRGCTDAKIKP